jgi:hypothetical protein
MLSMPVIELICPSCVGRRSARVFIFISDNDFQFHRQAVVASSFIRRPTAKGKCLKKPHTAKHKKYATVAPVSKGMEVVGIPPTSKKGIICGSSERR